MSLSVKNKEGHLLGVCDNNTALMTVFLGKGKIVGNDLILGGETNV